MPEQITADDIKNEPTTDLQERVDELEDRLSELENEFESIRRREDEEMMRNNFGY